MNLSDIAKLRLINQQIAFPSFTSPREIVSWMGAMQAQDFNMAKWAIGIRSKNSTLIQIEDALDRGDILRTHLMRPTWHLVSSGDIYWMLDLTSPQLINALKFRDKELGLTKEIFIKTIKIIEKSLIEKTFISREELTRKFAEENIKTNENRLSHILYNAELNGIICSGKLINGKQTYSLLNERVPEKKSKPKDEAAAELAKRYFVSHGPATLKDFVWWSGLAITVARKAILAIEKEFVCEEINSEKYFFTSFSKMPELSDSLFFLPAYDEFIISYKDRKASLSNVHFKKAVSSNGIFSPVLVENGEVIGVWKRIIKKDTVYVEIQSFTNDTNSKVLKNAVNKYGSFLDKKVEVILSQK